MTYSSVENVELGLGADHANYGLGVRHPDSRVFVGGLLAALLQQIFDALVDVGHPLLERDKIFLDEISTNTVWREYISVLLNTVTHTKKI